MTDPDPPTDRDALATAHGFRRAIDALNEELADALDGAEAAGWRPGEETLDGWVERAETERAAEDGAR